MIKRLQKRFILITIGSTALVMILLIGVINAANIYQMDRKVSGILHLLSENNGKFPEFDEDFSLKKDFHYSVDMTEETQYETRYFMVECDGAGNITRMDVTHIAAVSKKEAREYMREIQDGKEMFGYKGHYKYLVSQTDAGTLTVFVDCRSQIQMVTLFALLSLIIAAACLFLIMVLILIMSKRAVKPVLDSIEKQKQFITDAGHEIKTPLAIISADADVLELSGGTNEWLESIRQQARRLDELVKNLLSLAKMDKENIEMVFSNFPVSEVVLEEAAPFQAVAKTQGKRFELNIQPGVTYHGDEGGIRKLVSILVDNAVKYADKEGRIKVTLTSDGKAVKLEVYNTGTDLPKENLDKLFDRFYRTDSSRSRDTGGYGIGLSIARNIVLAHKGKLTVQSENGSSIWFTAAL